MSKIQQLYPGLDAVSIFMNTQMWPQGRTVLVLGGASFTGKSMAACRIAEEALAQGRNVHYASPVQPESQDEMFAQLVHPCYHLHRFSWYTSAPHHHNNQTKFLEVLSTFENVATRTSGAVFVMDHLVPHLTEHPDRLLRFMSMLDATSGSLVLTCRSGRPAEDQHRNFGINRLHSILQQRMQQVQAAKQPEDYLLHVLSHQVESICSLSQYFSLLF
ncbi:hypothetical protein, partial [Deinococcus cellulosilyticus]